MMEKDSLCGIISSVVASIPSSHLVIARRVPSQSDYKELKHISKSPPEVVVAFPAGRISALYI